MNEKPLPTIGVDKFTYCKFTGYDGTSGAAQYGAAKALLGVVEVAMTDTANNAVFDADNGAYASSPYIENGGFNITQANITPEIASDWTGVDLHESGGYENNAGKTPEFAAMWRLMLSDGTYRYARNYLGTFSFPPPTGGQTKPSSGAPNYQTVVANYKRLSLKNGREYYYTDEGNFPDGVTQEAFEAEFFADPNYYPEAME
jgi:phi13 family phage major tail protein